MAASPVKSFGIRDLLGLPEQSSRPKETFRKIEPSKYDHRLSSLQALNSPDKISGSSCLNNQSNWPLNFSTSDSPEGIPFPGFLPLHLPLSLGLNGGVNGGTPSQTVGNLGCPLSLKTMQTLSELALGLQQSLGVQSALMPPLLDLAGLTELAKIYPPLDLCDLERLNSGLAFNSSPFQNTSPEKPAAGFTPASFSPIDSRLFANQTRFTLESGEHFLDKSKTDM